MKLIYLYEPPNTPTTVENFVSLLEEFAEVIPIYWSDDDLIPAEKIPIVFWTDYIMKKIEKYDKVNILGVGFGGVIASRIHYLMKEKINKIILVNCGLPYKEGILDFLNGKTSEETFTDIVTPKDLAEDKISFKNIACYTTQKNCDIKQVLKFLCHKNIPSDYQNYKVSRHISFQIDKDLELSDLGRESVLSYENCYFIFSEDDYFMKFSSVDEIDWLQMKKRYYIRHDWRRWTYKIKNCKHLIEYDQPEMFAMTVKHILEDLNAFTKENYKDKSWKTKWEKQNSFRNPFNSEEKVLTKYKKKMMELE